MVRQGVERIAQKFQFEMVRRVGLEPTRRETPAPKAGASASSATGALPQPIGRTPRPFMPQQLLSGKFNDTLLGNSLNLTPSNPTVHSLTKL